MRRVAARPGRAGPGARRHAWGSCSPTGPSSTGSTPPRCTSAPRRSRSTTPTRPSRSSTRSSDAEARILVTEQAFARPRRRPRRASSTVIVVDDEAATDVEVAAPRRADFDFEAAWQRRRARRRAHADLHLGHHRAAQGRAAHAREPDLRRCSGFDEVIAFPDDGRVVSWLPMAHIAERACSHYLPMLLGFTHHLLPGPAPGGRLPARGAADLVLRRPAHLGEAQGGDRGRRRRPSRTRRASRRPSGRSTSGCARSSSSRPASRSRTSSQAEHAKADELVLSKIRERLGLDQVESVNVGRGAHAARGDRVLPRDRRSRSRSCGGCRRPPATAPATRPTRSRSARSARPRRAWRSSWPTTARC